MEQHRVSIETTTADPFYPGHPGYYAECELCGHLMEPDTKAPHAQHAANQHLRQLGLLEVAR